MSKILKEFYLSLPGVARSAAASARGAVLVWRRYSRSTPRLVAEAQVREVWDKSRWISYQSALFNEILHQASRNVPAYRAGRPCSESGGISQLEDWPVVDKDSLREDPESFVDERLAVRRLSKVHTSGTTGKPLTLWRDRTTNVHWHALFERRWKNWYGVGRDDPWAILGGQLVVRTSRERPPFWVWNTAMRQLYCSVYHLKASTAASYIEAFRRRQLQYLLGYTSALASLGRFILDQHLEAPPLKVVITNAEPVSDEQRAIIERAFGCPVRETYGMAEIAAGAGECSAGKLHWWPDASVLEVQTDSGEVLREGEGALVATSLINRVMPLIRYKVGDRVRLSSRFDLCECGRRLPILESVEGRLDDLVVTPDGRQIGRLDPVFKGDFDITRAQIAQVAANELEVRYVSNASDPKHLEEAVRRELLKRVGPMRVRFCRKNRIECGKNGKFRAVVNEVVAS